ncbi:hypothetical protein M8J77_004840 [Diaphorina citri]|nr:hypothetical protein M8J77_004840 [Diaphorina citri]
MDHGYESLMKERDHYQKEYAFIVDKLVSIPLKFHNSSRESPLSNLSNLILERDQYYRECEQQRINNDSRSDAVHCELKRRLSDQGREISDLKHKYRLLEEEEYVKRQTGSDKATEMRGTGTGIDLDSYLSLQDEKDKLYVSNCKLQQENTELLSRLKKVQTESCSMQEDRIQSLETERRHLLSKQSDLTSRLVDLEEENRGLKKKLYVFENELSEERNALQSIRRVQEQTDQALLSFRKTHDSLECQIRDLKDDNARLQVERDNLACQLQSLRDDNHRMRTGLVQLDQQKDSILMALDSKIDLISRLERDVSSKDSKIELLEDRIAKLKSALE